MPRLLPLIALLFSFLQTGPAQAGSKVDPASDPATTSRPVVLVRVLALEGTGPDFEEHRLFTSADGFVTTPDALGRVGSQVGGAGLAEGGYHTLFVQLADEYEVVQQDGTRTLRRFSDENRSKRVRVRGMIMVRGGQATPLQMLEDPSYYGSRRDTFRGRHGHDDD